MGKHVDDGSTDSEPSESPDHEQDDHDFEGPWEPLTDPIRREIRNEGGASIGFMDLVTQTDYVRAAKSEKRGQGESVYFGVIGVSWEIDKHGVRIYLAMDAPFSKYPPLSGVRIRIATEEAEMVYLMPFAIYNSEYVVSELTIPLPESGFTVSVNPEKIELREVMDAPEELLAESIEGAGPETLAAWRSIAAEAPKRSAFANSLAKILRTNL